MEIKERNKYVIARMNEDKDLEYLVKITENNSIIWTSALNRAKTFNRRREHDKCLLACWMDILLEDFKASEIYLLKFNIDGETMDDILKENEDGTETD